MESYGTIGKVDAVVRCILAGVVILSVLMSPAVPAWLAIVMTYPVFTAMVRIDPIYMLVGWSLASLRVWPARTWIRGPAL